MKGCQDDGWASFIYNTIFSAIRFLPVEIESV